MSNRYDEELPQDLTDREIRENLLSNQTMMRVMPFIGGGIAVAFRLYSVIGPGFGLGSLITAAMFFVAGFLAFALVELVVFVLRRLKVPAAAVYLTAALAPIILGILVTFARN